MSLSFIDFVAFGIFFLLVVFIAVKTWHKTNTVEDYFLAGRNLPWWVIGFALLATGISTEQTVGITGEGFRIGLAIASYQWLASVSLVVISLFILPKFLRAGISTIPEYLQYRYNKTARVIMGSFVLVVYILAPMASVMYSGALAFETFFKIEKIYFVWAIGISSAIFIIRGGLSTVVWTDLVFVSGVMISMLLITAFGLNKMGGFETFSKLADGRLHAILPADSEDMPWPSVFLGGLWIAHFFYWGFNQFTTQRAFASQTLSVGQKGMLLTASILLVYAFILIFPGIIAYELYAKDILHENQAFPVLLSKLLPPGLKGFAYAALFGGVLASLNNMFNSASSLFTLDIYQTIINPKAGNKELVMVGRISTAILILICCVYAPNLHYFVQFFKGGIYEYLQTIWGVISPGIVAVFIVGFLSPKTPPLAGVIGLLMNPIIYVAINLVFPHFSEHINIALTFLILIAIMLAISIYQPLLTPQEMPEKNNIKFERNLMVFIWGIFIILIVIALYVIFI